MNIFIVGYSGFHSGRKNKTRHCFSLKNTSKESTSDSLHSEKPVNFKSCFYKIKILQDIFLRNKTYSTLAYPVCVRKYFMLLSKDIKVLLCSVRYSVFPSVSQNALCSPYIAGPAAPRRCGAGCWIWALLGVCLYYCHIKKCVHICQLSRLMIINPSAVQKYCQNK